MFRGDIPSSVMKVKRDEMSTDPILGSYEESGFNEFKGTEKDKLHKAFTISGRGAANGALSIFARNICRTVVLLYSKPGDVIVDPFIGHNSRMETCITEGRHYHGYDVSIRFMKDNYLIASQLRKEFPNMKIELNLHTSENMVNTPDNYGDFTVTSPPYWNIEDYGDELEQLGKYSQTYEIFMSKLFSVARENYRTLKSGAFAAWYINDFRRNGKFYPYHVDTMNMLIEAGFQMWDIMIVDLGRAFRESFISQIVEQKILPKRHEYGIIVRKP
jgi:DNA modification methylase